MCEKGTRINSNQSIKSIKYHTVFQKINGPLVPEVQAGAEHTNQTMSMLNTMNTMNTMNAMNTMNIMNNEQMNMEFLVT